MLNVLFTTVEWMSSITDTAGSTRASSSTTSSVDVNVEPAPPYASSTSTPMKPCSKSPATISGRITPASSMLRTCGATSLAANRAAASRIISSSSSSADTGCGAATYRAPPGRPSREPRGGERG